MSKTLYEILEVLEGATPTEIRDAYRRLAMKWHPDRNPGNKQEAEARFKEIAYAYKVLSEAEERSKYDDLINKNARQTSDFSSREKPCGDEGLSGDSAQQLFFEQIIDLAADLASRGFTES